MRRISFVLAVSGLLPSLAHAQFMGNLPYPVVMIANFSKQIAICEAAQEKFKGETLKYLLEVDRIAPGFLESSRLQDTAQELVRSASATNLSGVTESACYERVFPVARKAIDALPCYSARDWKECPPIGRE